VVEADDGFERFVPFTATVLASGHRWVVELRGELDLATRPLMLAVLDPVLGGGASTLVLEVSELTFADGGAVQSWYELAESLRARGGTLVLRNAKGVVRKVAEIAGLDRVAVVEAVRSART
jgi:anti-anti-sigma factor